MISTIAPAASADTLLTPEMLARVARLFAALSDESRLRIMLRLRENPATVGEVAAALDLAQPSVSKHIAVLRDAGLVTTRRDGAMTAVSIADRSIFNICEQVCGVVLRRHASDFEALGFSPAPPTRVAFKASHPTKS